MAKQFSYWNTDSHRVAHDAGDSVIGPAHFHIGRDGNYAVCHAVEQGFQLRTALADGGKVFFQTPGRAVQSHAHLRNLVTAGDSNTCRKIAGSYLLGETHDAAQPTRNYFRDKCCEHKLKEQRKRC